jgi:hypothetical protein
LLPASRSTTTENLQIRKCDGIVRATSQEPRRSRFFIIRSRAPRKIAESRGPGKENQTLVRPRAAERLDDRFVRFTAGGSASGACPPGPARRIVARRCDRLAVAWLQGKEDEGVSSRRSLDALARSALRAPYGSGTPAGDTPAYVGRQGLRRSVRFLPCPRVLHRYRIRSRSAARRRGPDSALSHALPRCVEDRVRGGPGAQPSVASGPATQHQMLRRSITGRPAPPGRRRCPKN